MLAFRAAEGLAWLRTGPPCPPSARAQRLRTSCQSKWGGCSRPSRRPTLSTTYRWHLEKNATQTPAISWRLTAVRGLALHRRLHGQEPCPAARLRLIDNAEVAEQPLARPLHVAFPERRRPVRHGCIEARREVRGRGRDNAAAALGNLARNGDALIADLLANDVPKALILLAKEYASEKSSSKKSSSVGDKQTPAHGALFSLGNLCAHEECRSALIKLGVRNALQQLRTSEDELLRKYALRVLAKLENS